MAMKTSPRQGVEGRCAGSSPAMAMGREARLSERHIQMIKEINAKHRAELEAKRMFEAEMTAVQTLVDVDKGARKNDSDGERGSDLDSARRSGSNDDEDRDSFELRPFGVDVANDAATSGQTDGPTQGSEVSSEALPVWGGDENDFRDEDEDDCVDEEKGWYSRERKPYSPKKTQRSMRTGSVCMCAYEVLLEHPEGLYSIHLERAINKRGNCKTTATAQNIHSSLKKRNEFIKVRGKYKLSDTQESQ